MKTIKLQGYIIGTYLMKLQGYITGIANEIRKLHLVHSLINCLKIIPPNIKKSLIGLRKNLYISIIIIIYYYTIIII